MSGTLTTGFRRRILDHVFRGVPLGTPGFDIALTRRVASANAAVSQLDEPTGLGYARPRITLDTTDWLLTLAGEVANAADVFFPVASGTWGTVAGWAWVSVETSPIVCAVGTLVQPYRIISGQRPKIGPQQMSAALYD